MGGRIVLGRPRRADGSEIAGISRLAERDEDADDGYRGDTADDPDERCDVHGIHTVALRHPARRAVCIYGPIPLLFTSLT